MVEKDSWLGFALAGIAAFGATLWGSLDVWLKVLCLLAVLDCLAGLSSHIVAGTLSREAFLKGANQKFIMVLLVAASTVIQYYLTDELHVSVPLTLVAAGFYGAREFLSLLRHAAAVGVSIPPGLLEAGEKFEAMAGGATLVRKETRTTVSVKQTDTVSTKPDPGGP